MYYMMNFNRAWSDAEIVAYSALGDDLGLIGNNVGDDLTLTSLSSDVKNGGSSFKNKSFKGKYKNKRYKGGFK